MNTQRDNSSRVRNSHKQLIELIVFAMLGTIMFVSKIIMEVLPNIHLLGMLTMTYTIVFRAKALIPIYVYVMLNGLFAGFAHWWIPYLYIWAILWAITMLIPKKMPKVAKCIIYPIVCSLFGFAFGIIYAPGQALMYGFNFEQTVAWVLAGFPFDVIHGVSNLFVGTLIFPFSELIAHLMKLAYKR